MRSDGPLALPGRGVAAIVVLLLIAGCGGDQGSGAQAGPRVTEAERSACSQLQDLVDAIAEGEPLDAASSLNGLESALEDSGNAALSDNGRAFFATISATVPDAGELTVEESAAVGDRALADAQPRLGALLDECAALGVPIANLPTGPDR